MPLVTPGGRNLNWTGLVHDMECQCNYLIICIKYWSYKIANAYIMNCHQKAAHFNGKETKALHVLLDDSSICDACQRFFQKMLMITFMWVCSDTVHVSYLPIMHVIICVSVCVMTKRHVTIIHSYLTEVRSTYE